MHRCGAKGMVGAQDIHPSNTCLPLTVGVASGRTVGVAWVVGRQAGGDLSNIWKKNSWKLGFGCGNVAVQCLAGVVGFRCPLPYFCCTYVPWHLKINHCNFHMLPIGHMAKLRDLGVRSLRGEYCYVL